MTQLTPTKVFNNSSHSHEYVYLRVTIVLGTYNSKTSPVRIVLIIHKDAPKTKMQPAQEVVFQTSILFDLIRKNTAAIKAAGAKKKGERIKTTNIGPEKTMFIHGVAMRTIKKSEPNANHIRSHQISSSGNLCVKSLYEVQTGPIITKDEKIQLAILLSLNKSNENR